MVKGFDFSREAFEGSLREIVAKYALSGFYDVTTTMTDRGKRVSDRVYFIPFDRLSLVIYSTVDVITDRSPVESTSRWDVEMYWVMETVDGTWYRLFKRLNRTYDMFEVMNGVIGEAVKEIELLAGMTVWRAREDGFVMGWPYE